MYAVLLLVLLVLVSLALIGYPIWKGHGDEGEQADWLSPTMASEKDIIMGALSEIEFDYHMKKTFGGRLPIFKKQVCKGGPGYLRYRGYRS
ncbi:hypothetical protein UF75_3382 [Desulfosporosinus sp. I2]|uniref:hypothetical protein n=1 Tax=Desulfosporosinus sp. I2 TaxID=1617025 RepID=UPI0005F047D4|nr:hypothetical protein [Desulfosporosinus sp. I2]KJR46233.1 hypothetical protein UF75_3382 [Desulfosporosinus sp. I2]